MSSQEERKKVKSLSHIWLFATPWTVARQAPLSRGFSKQEYWSGLPFPSPGDLPNPAIEPRSPALQTLIVETFISSWGDFTVLIDVLCCERRMPESPLFQAMSSTRNMVVYQVHETHGSILCTRAQSFYLTYDQNGVKECTLSQQPSIPVDST